MNIMHQSKKLNLSNLQPRQEGVYSLIPKTDFLSDESLLHQGGSNYDQPQNFWKNI